MPTYHIHIEGRVQGVGFRPFVYQLACAQGLNGYVNNTVDGVHIEITTDEASAQAFYHEVIQSAPSISVISKHHMITTDPVTYDEFQIIDSSSNQEPKLFLTPDLGICNDCRNELRESENRRKNYPFITCTQCGPRFSITRELPYDRHTTTMDPFHMCDDCNKEYNDPTNRRHYSQTNSCPVCRIEMNLTGSDGISIEKSEGAAIKKTVDLLKAGNILAVKGIGGYLLMADANSRKVIRKLRTRKHRPYKPFALLYPDIDRLKNDALVSAKEHEALESIESPIVLVRLEPGSHSKSMEMIAPKLDRIGVMLPYTPLLALISEEFGDPLIATSGNVSGSPILYKDDAAFHELALVADYFLPNNREIVVPQDDSVIQYSPSNEQKIVVRRSRGYAPSLVHAAFDELQEPVLAMGADMKSAFGLFVNGNTYISQYLGDLVEYDTQEGFKTTLDHMLSLFGAKPRKILHDQHPTYFSTGLAREYGASMKADLVSFQHHEAHFAGLLAENDLLGTDEKILGVIWDGTGYGSDEQVWGGEYFLYDDLEFTRVGHIPYFPHLLGDKMSIEPRLSALSLFHGVQGAEKILKEKFTDTEWDLYLKMCDSPALKTSSVGRMFDAVASLLGITDFSSYEGEAAMWLEAEAWKYLNRSDEDPRTWKKLTFPDGDELLSEIVMRVNRGDDIGEISLWFHQALVSGIHDMARTMNVETIGFSGGVFQNSLLIDLVGEMSDEYKLLFHQQLSPNDENIAFGQIACYLLTLKKGKQHVLSDTR